MSPPLITLEEHFLCEEKSIRALYCEQLKYVPGLDAKLSDIGPIRLKTMDENKISMQVVSHGPGPLNEQQSRAANDQLARAVKANPDRFAGFASLPVCNPEESAKELKRCIRELGFVGALIDNRAINTYYDGPEYEPMWAAAHDLDVPIYLHPTWPSKEQAELLYTGNFDKGATSSLGGGGWGWHSDVGLHVLRLFSAGVFDKFPRLKIIAGHMGEMLPYMLDRIVLLSSPRWGKRERDFREVYNSNIWITTSGVWSIDPMATILRNTKIDRILYSVDYPFARNEDGLIFMEQLEASGMVTGEQLEHIAHKNAEELLGLQKR